MPSEGSQNAPGDPGVDLGQIASQLCRGDDCSVRRHDGRVHAEPLPSRDAIVRLVEMARATLFPGYFGAPDLESHAIRDHLESTLEELQLGLRIQLRRCLAFGHHEDDSGVDGDAWAQEMVARLLSRLPHIQQRLAADVQAAYEGDPAARSPDETIFCYPGVLAVTNYRLAHELHLLGAPLLPRIISEHAHSTTGIDIHPGAAIGQSFFIDHGTGVVIGETCQIGDRVRIYQGVTLGAKSFHLDAEGRPVKGIARHPVIEDGVIVYSGATILGRVTIGKDSIIGGNVWLTASVPPGSRITVQPPRQELFIGGDGI